MQLTYPVDCPRQAISLGPHEPEPYDTGQLQVGSK